MKRMMVIMLTIMMLSSCYYADQVFGDIKESHEMAQSLKKNRGGQYIMKNTSQEYTKL